jgi:4-hydroxybenzoyl-CoA thioesterase
MGLSFKKNFVVGWGDCAPSGAVYYPNYFRWFDQSVWDLFDAAGLPIPELEHAYGVVGLPLMNLSCNFRAPCRLRDRVWLETRIAAIEPKHFTIEHDLSRDDRVLVSAVDQRFWGVRPKDDPGRLRREAIPSEVIERLRNAESGAAAALSR